MYWLCRFHHIYKRIGEKSFKIGGHIALAGLYECKNCGKRKVDVYVTFANNIDDYPFIRFLNYTFEIPEEVYNKIEDISK